MNQCCGVSILFIGGGKLRAWPGTWCIIFGGGMFGALPDGAMNGCPCTRELIVQLMFEADIP